jgi:hypothetical protein
MHPRRNLLTALFAATAMAAASSSNAQPPEQYASAAMLETLPTIPAARDREPISARVSLGCQHGSRFIARVLAQAGRRSATRFALGNGFVAVYSDGSWIHIAEFEQPCVVASGSRADMITYFETE